MVLRLVDSVLMLRAINTRLLSDSGQLFSLSDLDLLDGDAVFQNKGADLCSVLFAPGISDLVASKKNVPRRLRRFHRTGKVMNGCCIGEILEQWLKIVLTESVESA